MDRTLLIGLDGATFVTLDPFMQSGEMPFLRRMVDQGFRAVLNSTAHPLTPPAWTTIVTGHSPGHHGIYDFLRASVRDNGAFFTLTDFRDIRCETLWTYVSRSGGSVTSLNYPLLSPPPVVTGNIVPGLNSWRHLRRNIHPPDLYDRLRALPGFNPREISWEFENEKKALECMGNEEIEQWISYHIIREKHWFEMARYVMRTSPADFTAIVLDGVDKLQHSCWRFLAADPDAEEMSKVDLRLREMSLEYFRQLDRILEGIVEAAGSDTRVFLVSDHGFGPTTHVLRVNKWLEEQGYLKWAEEGNRGALKAGNHIPVDWTKTVAYAQSAATNGVHIRVAEQPGQPGIPRHEYEAFRDRLAAGLLAIRDPATGEKLVKGVLKRETSFAGPAMNEAPDLTLVMRDHGFISVLNREPAVWQRPTTIGTHYPEGVFMGFGPGIRSGVRLPPQEIVDVAPTLLCSLGLPIPDDYEGSIIKGCFEEELLSRPIDERIVDERSEPTAPANGAEIDEEEEGAILDRLRALGYVE